MTCADLFAVDAVAPFNLDLTAQLFQDGDRQIRTYKNNAFQQVLRLSSKLALATLTSNGTVEKPDLSCALKSNSALTAKDRAEAKTLLKYIFNLDFPLCNFYDEVANDAVMSQIARRLYGFKFPTTPTVFEGLVDAIVEQQISIKVARTIEDRLTKKFGDPLQINGETYFAFPTAQNIADACISDIQTCGLSQRKAEYIWNAARLIADGKLDLEGYKTQQDPDQIISELDAIKGIGVWTAELTMLRGMQKLDALPADDFGIRRVISRYYRGGQSIKAAEARQIAEAWGRWKGLAAFYLIVAEVKDIKT